MPRKFKKEKWNEVTIKEYLNENNEPYDLLDVYWVHKSYQKQKWVTLKCKNEKHPPFNMWWNNFLKDNNRCRMCYAERENITLWNVEGVIEFYNKNNYKIIDIHEWKDVDTPISVIDINGYKVRKSISGIKQAVSNNNRKIKSEKYIFHKNNPHSYENMLRYMEINAPDYILLDYKYEGVKHRYKFEYVGEENIPIEFSKSFMCSWDCFINNVRHPYFSMSNSEIVFYKLLCEYGIKFEREVYFEGLKNKSKLRVDFYLTDYNIPIEIDGEFHRIAVDMTGGEDGLKIVKNRDSIKDEYFYNKGMRLIRIPYYFNDLDGFEFESRKILKSITKENI